MRRVCRTGPRILNCLIDAQAESVEQAYDAIVGLPAFYDNFRSQHRRFPRTRTPADCSECLDWPILIYGNQNVSFSYAGGPRVLNLIRFIESLSWRLHRDSRAERLRQCLARHANRRSAPAGHGLRDNRRQYTACRCGPPRRRAKSRTFSRRSRRSGFRRSVQEEVGVRPAQLRLGGLTRIRRRCHEALEAVGLQGQRHNDPFLLSKGERQRLAVAQPSVSRLADDVDSLMRPLGLDHRLSNWMMVVRDLHWRRIGSSHHDAYAAWLVAENRTARVACRRASGPRF